MPKKKRKPGREAMFGGQAREVRLTIRVHADDRARLEQLASRRGVSLHYLHYALLMAGLARSEKKG